MFALKQLKLFIYVHVNCYTLTEDILVLDDIYVQPL